MKPEETTVSFASLEIQLAAAGRDGWAIDAVARVDANASSRELFILSKYSPLWLDEVHVSPPFAVTMPREGAAAVAHITRPGAESAEWCEAELALRLRWSRPDADARKPGGRRGALETPCLVLPDMLPAVADETGTVSLRPPARLPRIVYGRPLPPELDAGGVAVPDRAGRGTTEHLQTVIFPSREGAPDFKDLVVTESTRQSERADFQQAYDYAVELRAYLDEQFGPGLPVRSVVCLTDAPLAYPTSGAYGPLPYAVVGGRKKDSGKPAHVIRVLAQAWLAGGLRLWGVNAADLALALGGAYGLYWVQKAGHQQYLQQLIEITERLIADQDMTEGRILANTVRAMELAFFRSLSSASVRSELRRFVHDHWGNFVEQSELIALLRKQGIAVPHVFA